MSKFAHLHPCLLKGLLLRPLGVPSTVRLWDIPDVTLFRKPPSSLRTQPHLLYSQIFPQCLVSLPMCCHLPFCAVWHVALHVTFRHMFKDQLPSVWELRGQDIHGHLGCPEDLFMASVLFDCLCPASLLCPPKLKSLHMEYWAHTVFLPPQCPDLKTEVAAHQVMNSQRAA